VLRPGSTASTGSIVMSDSASSIAPLALLRLQSWLSPAFPAGAYSYSHGLEWAVEVGEVHDCGTLVDWLLVDLRYGSGRNDAIFFAEAWRCVTRGDHGRLLRTAELAAAYRGTAEFALESSQQASACLATLRRVWPHQALDWLAAARRELDLSPVLSIVLGARTGGENIPLEVALPAFMQSYSSNLLMAGIRLVPLGQTDGQLAIARLEQEVLLASAEACTAPLEEIGSAAFRIDMASMAHETQYTRLFRS
jgi:urease accessory protein